MDKVNIDSSQAVVKMSSFSVDTRSMSSSPTVNSLVKTWLFNTAPDIDEPPFQFIFNSISIHPYYGFVCGRHDAAWQLRFCNPQDWDLGCLGATGWTHESLAFLDAAVQRGAVCWCTVLLEQSRYQTLCVSLAAVWRHYNEEVRKRYHQNFLLCNNNEITACIADLLNSFCEQVYAVAFLKVVQQHTTGKVGNSTICLWADNFRLQQWVFAKVMLKWKRVQFLTRSVVSRFNAIAQRDRPTDRRTEFIHQYRGCAIKTGTWYSGCRPWWMVVFWDGLLAHRWSPILLVTGSDVA